MWSPEFNSEETEPSLKMSSVWANWFHIIMGVLLIYLSQLRPRGEAARGPEDQTPAALPLQQHGAFSQAAEDKPPCLWCVCCEIIAFLMFLREKGKTEHRRVPAIHAQISFTNVPNFERTPELIRLSTSATADGERRFSADSCYLCASANTWTPRGAASA